MKEFVNFMGGRRYSAVSTTDNRDNNSIVQQLNVKPHKSLQSKPSLNRGLSILDSFFHQREQGKRARWPRLIFLLLTSGLILIGASIFIFLFQPYDWIFRYKLTLSDGGEIFNLWAKPPVHLYLKVYLYNITNHEAFLAGREKLNIQEIGPYVYRERLSHENITFNDNGTVSTIPQHPLEWQGHLSNGTEDDLLFLPNIALLAIAHLTAPKSYFLRLPVNLVIRQTNSQPIVNMTAKEFMMGYKSPLTTLGNTLLPHWIHFEKVGLIDRMYDFEGDYETFYTGEQDAAQSGLYDTFRGSQQLSHWNGEHCSNINKASDGTKFKSFIKDNETLLFFRKSMCRPQRLKRVGEETTSQGLAGVKYMFEDNALDNGAKDERNKCYCREGKCLAEGLADVTDCYYGFPIALSYPHFLDADPQLVENITGSSPNRSKHESYFLLNPASGLPLKLSVKFQINLAMKDVSSIAHVDKRFSNLVIPMLWFEIAMENIPDQLQQRFNLYLNILPMVEKTGLYGTFVIGLILSIIAVTRVAIRVSSSLTSTQKNQKYGNNLTQNQIYNACEEKLIDGERGFKITKDTFKLAKDNISNHTDSGISRNLNGEDGDDEDDYDSDDGRCVNIIKRCEFELENDDALSDLEYNNDEEVNSTEEDKDESNEFPVHLNTRNNSLIEIDLTTSHDVGNTPKQVEPSTSGVKRPSIHYLESVESREAALRIVESDDYDSCSESHLNKSKNLSK